MENEKVEKLLEELLNAEEKIKECTHSILEEYPDPSGHKTICFFCGARLK